MLYRLRNASENIIRWLRDRWLENIYFRTSRRPLNRVLIVKLDAIGDYVLARSFFYELKNSQMFRDCEFFLLCGARMHPITATMDGELFREILTIEPYAGKEAELQLFIRLKKLNFRCVVHPTFSPTPQAHRVIEFATAPARIGFRGDTANCSLAEKTRFEKYYTQLVTVEEPKLHEFEKLHLFFSEVLKQRSGLKKPFLQRTVTPEAGAITLCPGAQHAHRIWPAENYAALLSRLHAAFPGKDVFVVTGPSENELNAEIVKRLNFPVNTVCAPPFSELIYRLSASSLIICNDSAPAHLAVALDVPSVCISNGNHYKRFVPYPDSCEPRQVVLVPDAVKSRQPENPYYYGSDLDISLVHPDDVYAACVNQLKNA